MRIEKIDKIRGHLLIAMILDHFMYVLGPSVFILYNGRGELWVSAAEGFVLIAGFMIGYLYVYKNNKTIKEITKKLLKRTLILYFISVAFSFVSSFLFWNYQFPQSGIFSQDVQPAFFDLLLASFLFQHHYGWSEILALYVYFVAISPLIIIAFRYKKGWFVLVVSVLLWFLTFTKVIYSINVSYASVLAWQILFVFGIFFGANFKIITEIFSLIKRKSILFLSLILAFIFTIVGSLIFPHLYIGGVDVFDKGTLGIGRLILVPLWMFGYWLYITYIVDKLPPIVAKGYSLLGRHSLFVYSLHAVLLTIGTVFGGDNGIIVNSLISMLGLFVIIVATKMVEKIR